jgi:hypothetical protein
MVLLAENSVFQDSLAQAHLFKGSFAKIPFVQFGSLVQNKLAGQSSFVKLARPKQSHSPESSLDQSQLAQARSCNSPFEQTRTLISAGSHESSSFSFKNSSKLAASSSKSSTTQLA